MQGRITEKHLVEAESSFPGIGEMYEALPVKPPTFLQLVWIYEEAVAEELASMGFRPTVAIG